VRIAGLSPRAAVAVQRETIAAHAGIADSKEEKIYNASSPKLGRREDEDYAWVLS
jgi:hypothetical protein